jgi:hypothetical protein
MARTAHKRPAALGAEGVKSEADASQGSAKRPRTSEANTAEELPPAPGSVLKVKMRNFMTYSNVEFAPGRRLNLILGPNGAPALPRVRGWEGVVVSCGAGVTDSERRVTPTAPRSHGSRCTGASRTAITER